MEEKPTVRVIVGTKDIWDLRIAIMAALRAHDQDKEAEQFKRRTMGVGMDQVLRIADEYVEVV